MNPTQTLNLSKTPKNATSVKNNYGLGLYRQIAQDSNG